MKFTIVITDGRTFDGEADEETVHEIATSCTAQGFYWKDEQVEDSTGYYFPVHMIQEVQVYE